MEEFKRKYVSPKEFQELGYLQELNRVFLHPLGMALVLVKDNNTGNVYIEGIQDHREEGISFGLNDTDPERVERFLKNFNYMIDQREKQSKLRGIENGFIEQIPE